MCRWQCLCRCPFHACDSVSYLAQAWRVLSQTLGTNNQHSSCLSFVFSAPSSTKKMRCPDCLDFVAARILLNVPSGASGGASIRPRKIHVQKPFMTHDLCFEVEPVDSKAGYYIHKYTQTCLLFAGGTGPSGPAPSCRPEIGMLANLRRRLRTLF